MKINDYQKLASRTINMNLSDTAVKQHALHGMVGEIGEIHSIYKKQYQGHMLEPEQEHLKKELGDLMWFVAEYATSQGWTLEEICKMNIEKLIARFPNGFEVDKSLHRKEGDI